MISAYTLPFGGFPLAAGRAADLFGRRRLFMVGLGVFALASLACGLAPSAVWLVVFRVVQGLGAAIVAPSALSLLTRRLLAGLSDRARSVRGRRPPPGAGPRAGCSAVCSPRVSGGSGVFLVNVPVGAVAILLAPRLLRESRDAAGPARLDTAGAVTATAGLALLVYGLTRAEQAGFGALSTLAALLVAAAQLGAFVAVERRVRRPLLPLLPLGMLRVRTFTMPSVAALALTAATTPPMFLAVLYQQQVLDFTAVETGLACAPVNLAVIAGSALGPRLVAAIGARPVMSGGLATIAVGALLLTATSPAGGYIAQLLPVYLLIGAGLGCASVASTASATSAVAGGQQGLASGLLNAAAQVGTVLGLAVFVTLAAERTDALTGTRSSETAQVAGYHWAFAGAALLALGAALATQLVLRPRH